MQHTSYSIEKRQNQWVIWACGARVLVCKHKKMAIMIARRATHMLRESPASDASRRFTHAHPSDQHSQAFSPHEP
jgi:hypothetical protein